MLCLQLRRQWGRKEEALLFCKDTQWLSPSNFSSRFGTEEPWKSHACAGGVTTSGTWMWAGGHLHVYDICDPVFGFHPLVPARQHPRPIPSHTSSMIRLGTRHLRPSCGLFSPFSSLALCSVFSLIRLAVAGCQRMFAAYLFFEMLLNPVHFFLHFKHAFPEFN